MNLTLEMLSGRQEGARREIRISPFKVGTDSFADWVLPSEPRAEPGQVTISRASDGFFLRASGTVLLEGHPLDPNMETRLGHGAELTIGGNTIRAMVSHGGGQFADASLSAAPTISSILADVTPGGESAGGLLPGRAGEGILSGTDHLPRGHTPLDGVEPAPAPGPKLLPEDWNSTSSTSEHAPAPDTAMRLGPSTPTPRAAPQEGSAIKAFLKAAGVEDEFAGADPVKLMEAAGGALAAAATGLAELEEGLEAFRREFGLAPGRREQAERRRTDAATLLSGESYLTEARIAAQFARIVEHQAALADGLAAYLAACKSELAPEAIMATAKGKGLTLRPKAQYWDAFSTAWANVAAPRFSPEEFAETYARMA
ncbi:MAG: type VI secretion system-associated FHA domain protein, partial [Pseudomonadota bacterium]